jgi:hypothetical protein
MVDTAKLLTAAFEGWFMCRLATDPDPNNEPRGRSGYTMALTSERELDQVIRLQRDAYVDEHMRRPARLLKREVGVTVRSVTFDGRPWSRRYGGDPIAGEHPLVGALVSLGGTNDIFPGPTFESRNNIVGSDDTMAFVVNPFELAIDSPRGKPELSVQAVDHLDPADPTREIWEIDNPATYGRRFPTAFSPSSAEAMQAISVFDGYAYFRGRRAFLSEEIARLDANQPPLSAPAMPQERFELAAQEAKSRLYQLEFWGDRVINKLGFLLQWEHDINGLQTVKGDIGGEADENQPWHVRYWFGGWDGDLLLGYMRGALSIPLRLPEPPLAS